MKIETKTGIVILHVTDLMESHRLDPIRITLEDIEPGKGRINIECYGKAWASYWGGMGRQTIAQFFAGCDNGYLIGNLAPGMNERRFSTDALVQHAKQTIQRRRKGYRTQEAIDFGRLDREDARRLIEQVDAWLTTCETPSDCWHHSKLLAEIFCEEWFHYLADKAAEPNPDYTHLARICDAVREALRELAKPTSAPNPANESTH